MRDYHLPEALWLSFYSKPFYQSVAATWRKRGLAYMALLGVLITLPAFLQIQRAFHEGLENFRSEFTRQLPEIVISKGEIRTPESKPYEIRFGKGPADWILIDPTGQTPSLSQTTAAMLITKKQIFLRLSSNRSRVFSLADLGDQTIDGKQVHHWIDRLQRSFSFLFYPVLFLIQTGLRLLQAAVLALAGWAVMRQKGSALGFPAVLNVAITSLTPALLAETFFLGAPKSSPWGGVAMVFLTVGYFIFALNAAAGPTQPA